MSAYRIYWFDPDDRITGADNLIADTDDIVRHGAKQHLRSASAIEVWNGARLVVRVAAPRTESGPASVPTARAPAWRRVLKCARGLFMSAGGLPTV